MAATAADLYRVTPSGEVKVPDAAELRKRLMQRWGALENERSSWKAHWQDITKHLLPRNGRYMATESNRTGRDQYNEIYDNSATRALRILGAGMMAGGTSPARPWFRLAASDPDLNEFHAVRIWLEEVVRRMQLVFQKSNTYRTLHHMYEELGAFGTAASIVVADFDKVIHHHPLTAGEFAIAQDWQGRVTTLYREFQRSVAEVVKEFGYENCSHHVQNSFDQGNLEHPVEILHAIEPREDRDHTQADSANMPWKSCYLEKGGETDKILRVSGFERFPVLAARWHLGGGDIYGNSPGMEALGDIRQLQAEQIRKAEAIARQADPALQAPSNLKELDRDAFPGGSSFYDPGGIAFVDQTTAHSGIRTQYDNQLRLDHLLEDIRDVRERVRSAFHADLFLMLALAGPQTRMTATEVAERHEEKLLMLGPVLERLQNELLEPLIDQTFLRMFEAGALPDPPEELEGQELTVEFISMLAQAQRAIGAGSIDRFWGHVREVAEIKPDVLDKINADQDVDVYTDMLGVDQRLVVPTAEVQQLREARARAQAAQDQLAAQQVQAKAAKDLAQAPTEGKNALTDILGGGGGTEGAAGL